MNMNVKSSSIRNGNRLRVKAFAALLILCVAPLPLAAQGTIYRCHALNGDLLFQDQPCNKVSGTREAKANAEGEIVPAAAPAPEDGDAVTERYSRYLDQVAADRREQQAADEAETARLKAQADVARPPAISAGSQRPDGCSVFGAGGECVASVYDQPYGVFFPRQHYPAYYGPYRPPIQPSPPLVAPPPPSPKPSLPRRGPRDAKVEVSPN